MPINEIDKRKIEKAIKEIYERRFPSRVRDQVWFVHKIRGNSVVFAEERPYFQNPEETTHMPFARFVFDEATSLWDLYWSDRNGKWHIYDEIPPSKDFNDLAREVDEDPTCIFFG